MTNHLSKSLNGISFVAMPDIPYDILFHRQSLKNDCYVEDRLFRIPFSVIRKAFFPTKRVIEYSCKADAKILFYLSEPDRKSNIVNFKKVVSTSEHSDILIEHITGKSFSMLGFYLLFVLSPIWYIQMSKRGLSLIEKFQVLRGLVESFRIRMFFKKIEVNRYNLLVCYYDSILHECLLALMFKKAGVATATMQHGQFNAWRENTFVNCGLEFFASPSDYHLCWNKFAREEAMKCGWKEERLPILGVMSNIGRGKERWIKPLNDIFGVVISHPSWEHENIEMIKAANILAEKYHLKYYLKLHPNYKEDYFSNLVDNQHYLGNIEKGIDTLKYVNKVDFTIVGSTSFFVEMVYTYHDILRYSSQLPSDKYRDIKMGSVFHDKSEIINCYQSLSDKSKTNLFEYLCETEDTRNAYHDFFCKFDH